jgi:hypothetical protein
MLLLPFLLLRSNCCVPSCCVPNAAAHLCLHEVLRRGVVQHPRSIDAARHDATRHAQLAAQVHAGQRVVAAVEAALDDKLSRPQALQPRQVRAAWQKQQHAWMQAHPSLVAKQQARITSSSPPPPPPSSSSSCH